VILLDAFRAESFKLRRNLVIVGVAFVLSPAMIFALGFTLEMMTVGPVVGDFVLRPEPVDLAMNGLASGGNLFAEMLLIVGAAFLFAGEYRWETWRAILPRTDRAAVMSAKMLVFCVAAFSSLVASGLAGLLAGFASVAASQLRPSWPDASGSMIALGAAINLLASMLQILTMAALSAVVAVMTRSLLAAVIAPTVAHAGFELVAARINLTDADVLSVLAPSVAANTLRELAAYLLGDPDAIVTPLAAPGLMALAAWVVLLFGLAIALFRRQDLPRE
jgi:ABC-2 type transport system permease protein